MTPDALLVFAVLLIAMVLFVTEWLRMDLTAMLALLALILLRILTPEEALAGFSDPVVLMIAALFVVGGGLHQTGLAHYMGQALTRISGTSEVSLIVVTMTAVALLSGFMSSAGSTAVLIPVVVDLAWRAKVSPSKLLIPLALGALIGGLLTLIGTPPNLVVNNQLIHEGLPPFGFFSFTPIGIVALLLGMGFIVLVGRHMLPDHSQGGAGYGMEASDLSLDDLASAYHLPQDLFRMRVRESSPLVGQTLAEAQLRQRYGVNVLEIQRWPQHRGAPGPTQVATPAALLDGDDILHVQGDTEAVARLSHEERLSFIPNEQAEGLLISREVGMVELLLPPRSHLIGQTLQESRFRDRYHVTVLSVRRYGKPLEENPATVSLRFGDTLLALGTWDRIRTLQREHQNFVVVGQPREMIEAQHTPRRARIAGGVMLVMLAMMSLNILPPVVVALLAAAAMVLSHSLSMEQAYEALNWPSLILLAAMLPVATALEKTGGLNFVATALTASLGGFGPVVVLGGVFMLTGLLSQVVSNTATAVLMAPIAYYVAVGLGISPRPLLVAVALAASTAFATPMSTISGAMVMAPGGYRFGDYVKIGGLLQILLLFGCLIFVPLFFPF
jgi:di/tricarboxylate transporter